MLSGQWDTTIHALKDVETGTLWNFGVHDVKYQIAIFNSVLELGRQALEVFSIEIRLLGKLQIELTVDEAKKC